MPRHYHSRSLIADLFGAGCSPCSLPYATWRVGPLKRFNTDSIAVFTRLPALCTTCNFVRIHDAWVPEIIRQQVWQICHTTSEQSLPLFCPHTIHEGQTHATHFRLHPTSHSHLAGTWRQRQGRTGSTRTPFVAWWPLSIAGSGCRTQASRLSGIADMDSNSWC